MSAAPLFTIFTPTYNRAHTLPRAFKSLRQQTLHDFEWLVVDDGSTDDTQQLVAQWAAQADFPLRYLRQAHAGKHVAHNRAAKEARGFFFGCLDSDDTLLPQALERIVYHWNAIPPVERVAFSGIDGLCADTQGRIVGDTYPWEPFDSNLREMKYVHRLRGETWGVVLTDIVRRYPFPEVPETDFVPEGIVWLDVAKKYKSRAVNEVFRTYHFNETATGATLTKRAGLRENAPGRWHFYVWLLNNDLEYFLRAPVPFLKAAVALPVTGWFSARSLRQTLCTLTSGAAKFIVVSALPCAALVYAYETFGQRPGRSKAAQATMN